MQMTFYQELQLSSVGYARIATGRFRYPDNARTHFYRRNICNSYGGTKAGQYASTSGGLCGEYCLYHASYGAWLS